MSGGALTLLTHSLSLSTTSTVQRIRRPIGNNIVSISSASVPFLHCILWTEKKLISFGYPFSEKLFDPVYLKRPFCQWSFRKTGRMGAAGEPSGNWCQDLNVEKCLTLHMQHPAI